MGQNLETSTDKVLACEGGYCWDANDRGGETYRGIARKFFPAWAGWHFVDEEKAKRPLKRNEIIPNPALEFCVRDFYRVNFWRPELDTLPALVASEIMEAWVNYGGMAWKLVQRALVACGNTDVVADGKVGPKTLSALARTSEAMFLPAFDKVRIDYVNAIVAKNSSQLGFLKGWISRILKR